jgi:putative radical SAM enzyme (TIGR03279 family)
LFEVESVKKGSVAQQGGIVPGDKIVSVNGEPLLDYIDYIYFCAQRRLKIRVERGGTIRTLLISNGDEEDLGLSFTQPLLGKKRVCGNKCVFCFVHQLPRGMRKSLYVKDEDWRYSLVMGNYVTLSTISDDEIKRIIKRKASPLYISVHTVDEAQRRQMLGNENAVPIRALLKKFAAKGIRFHAQAVVCPGLNDGRKLEETIRFLQQLYPAAASLAVVPVGLTGHRQMLTPIEPVSQSVAQDTIKTVELSQKECLNSIGTRFVFAADEFYVRAGMPMPSAEEYETFDQIENGVGLVATLLSEAEEALESCEGKGADVSLATGEDAFAYIESIANRAAERSGARVHVYAAKNITFGGAVTVAGLLAGRDFVSALKGKYLGEKLLIPAAALRDDDVFLDDMTLGELSETLGVRVEPVCDGYQLVAQICGY